MYYYAEVLRGRRALRVIAIILGVFLVIAILLRLWAFAEHGPTFIASSLQTSPTAHVSSKTLADGTVETTVVDPVEKVHAVIDRRSGYFHIDAIVPSNRKLAGTFTFGDSAVTVDKKTGMKHIVMTEDMHGANLPVGILFAVASVIALVTATMLGGVLAKENDGHLELAWTKPVSRERLAVASIATDIATILISQLFAVAVILIICAMFILPKFYVNSQTPNVIVLALLGPVAWYSCLTAFSASLKRGLGMVCGLGWLAALMIPAVATGTRVSQSELGRSIHFIFQSLTYFDPIAYLSLHGGFDRADIAFQTAVGTLGFSAIALAVLTIVYLSLSVLQWRRVEA
ncbi:MAG TPA: hypothetical protein VFW34_01825 [Candidatus Rubrimentiphilum sp.]|nr:hypothetical protein [Candidatus Rubrimentiphilum sp.]